MELNTYKHIIRFILACTCMIKFNLLHFQYISTKRSAWCSELRFASEQIDHTSVNYDNTQCSNFHSQTLQENNIL